MKVQIPSQIPRGVPRPADFEAGQRWKEAQVPEAPQHPRPEVVQREATEEEIPRTCRRLANIARGNGWAVRITYSRGTWPGQRKKVINPVVDTVMMVAKRHEALVIATWVDGAFESGRTRQTAMEFAWRASSTRIQQILGG